MSLAKASRVVVSIIQVEQVPLVLGRHYWQQPYLRGIWEVSVPLSEICAVAEQ